MEATSSLYTLTPELYVSCTSLHFLLRLDVAETAAEVSEKVQGCGYSQLQSDLLLYPLLGGGGSLDDFQPHKKEKSTRSCVFLEVFICVLPGSVVYAHFVLIW